MRIPPGIRDRIPELAHLSDDELLPMLLESLERQVMEAAVEELSRRGQSLTKQIEGGGHVRKTGAEYMTNQLGEHHASFYVAFKGDQAGAMSASQAWVERLETFGGIETIGHASLRGTDGTNHHVFDEDIMRTVETMDPELLAKIDELMDPDRDV